MAQNLSDEALFLKVVTVGDSGVGKSSLIFRYIDGAFQTGYVSTIGVDFKVKMIKVGEQNAKLQVWDTAGQERFRTIARAYLRGAHGCIGVFDVSQPESLERLHIWIDEFLQDNPKVSPECIIIVGNKTDLPVPHVSPAQIQAVTEKYHCNYFEVSAKTDSGVSRVFETLASAMVTCRGPAPVYKQETVVSKPKSKAYCCS